MPFDPVVSTQLARKLKSLHIPGKPVLFTNVWDAPSANLALSFPQTKALSTASFAVAAVAGLDDAELSLEDNLYAISRISMRLSKNGKAASIPLAVDLQAGYGTKLVEAVDRLVELGVVGCNLEDANEVDGKGELIDATEHAVRVKLVIETARGRGVEDFVVNARTDCVMLGGTIEEAIRRGRIYLDAGATTVFVWGGMERGLRDAEVRQLVEALDGKVNVLYRKSMTNALSPKAMAELGVARISMGPGLWREGMTAVDKEMQSILEGYVV